MTQYTLRIKIKCGLKYHKNKIYAKIWPMIAKKANFSFMWNAVQIFNHGIFPPQDYNTVNEKHKYSIYKITSKRPPLASLSQSA